MNIIIRLVLTSKCTMHLAFKFTHAGVHTTVVIVQFAYREIRAVAFAGTMQVAGSLLEQAIIIL